MNFRHGIFLVLAALLTPLSGFSWGAQGHKIVIELAREQLSKAVIDSVDKYLDDMSWEDASVWMDQVRSDHHYDYMKPWHYVNIDRDKTYVKTKDPNVINQLEVAINILKNKHRGKDKSKTRLAIRVLFHLIGDLHQPLHCGYADDKGGNLKDVRFLKRQTNLHKVWDSEIIEAADIDAKSCHWAALDKKGSKEFENLTVESWVNESRLLLPEVYNHPGKIDQIYINKMKPVIEWQLFKAGYRLSQILNQSFT